MSTVVFWDIDGTLLSTARAGVFALEEAAREVCGADPHFAELKTAGLTDYEVAKLAIRTCGGDDSHDSAVAFLRAYERHLPERLGWRRGGVLPGVIEILEDLESQAHVTSLLLTGNTKAGARAKLRHYGLARYFGGGVYCLDGDSRVDIAGRARQVAAELADASLDSTAIFVVGDTPIDIECAKSIGARAIAVATGIYEAAELEAADPWITLGRLPSAPGFRELIFGSQEASARARAASSR